MPDLPISKTQLDKPGDRLRDSEDPPADLELLAEVLDAYDETLTTVTTPLRGMGFRPTGRIKVSRTIIDKLRRERRSSLKTIQDLAGARVTLPGGLDEQDATVRAFCDHYKDFAPPPYVIDRRMDPRSGYRAVHVVVMLQTIPVEVQFRTGLQHLSGAYLGQGSHLPALDPPGYGPEVGSDRRRADEARRDAEAVVRRGLTRLADLVERGGRSR